MIHEPHTYMTSIRRIQLVLIYYTVVSILHNKNNSASNTCWIFNLTPIIFEERQFSTSSLYIKMLQIYQFRVNHQIMPQIIPCRQGPITKIILVETLVNDVCNHVNETSLTHTSSKFDRVHGL